MTVVNNLFICYLAMIKTFACRETMKVFRRELSRKLPGIIQSRALMRLIQLDAANCLEDLRLPPSNRLEALKGERQGQWSMRINEQWRLCFSFEAGDAFDVEIVDYH